MLRILFSILLLALSFTPLHSDEDGDSSDSCASSEDFYCKHSHRHHTNNVYGPNIQVVTTPFRLTDCSIFSIGAEGGSNNYRFMGTVGYFISPKIHLKCTLEQLNQRVGYQFTTGRLQKWMRQSAVGGVIQYAFCHRWLESVEIYGSYACCPSRRIKTRPCCVKSTNLLNQVHRHIAGGKDSFAGLGLTVTPWHHATFSLIADYDYTTYKRKLSCSNLTTSGFGGTAKFHQDFDCNVSIDLKGELRRPFNYYEGALNWTTVHPYGLLTFGFYAGYTQGRDQLPNNWTTGVLISADFGGIPFFSNYRGCNSTPCVRGCCINPSFPVDSELLAWIATPAVRMPTVLAVSEEIVISTSEKCPPPPKPHPKPPEPSCKTPISVTIPDQTSLPIDTSAFFDRQGHTMVFTAQGLPDSFSINPVTGVIHGNIGEIGTIAVRVTGTTECGQTSESFLIINEDEPYGPYGPY